MTIRFDTYYDNDELTEQVHALAQAHPDLVEVKRLGTSHEGREILLVVVTNRATGPDTEKPAFWIDGNIHATELTASMCALHVLHTVLARYGDDPTVTRIVDEQVLYVVPRLNPDGAALAQAESPRYLRSGTRAYPREKREDGLHAMDIDGDGRILQMRMPDPTGDWKQSTADPRLMVKRRPNEEGGSYYRVLPEGEIENYDGRMIKMAPPLEGLDFNRNFPVGWRPEGKQKGAGDYPGSEAEIRAVLEFMAGHPNIYGAITYHTYSRAILRPFGDKPDEEMDTDDLWLMEAIGEVGTELTGYPCVSVYHDFRYHPKEVITGVFDDWLYEHRGVIAYTVELWDLPSAAGVTEKNSEKRFIDWFRRHPVEHDERIAAYVAAAAPAGLVEWHPFDHPQLGKVEIGGWNVMYTWRNPPPALLEAEIAPQSEFAIAFAAMAPRLHLATMEATPLGGGAHHIVAVLENRGFLGTYVTNQAKTMEAVRPIRVELELGEGVVLRSGEKRADVGHLEGRANKTSVAYYKSSPTDHRTKVEWVVEAPGGGTVTVTAQSERAGTARAQVVLPPT